ncbi:MAG: EAL domain-containing protein [Coleofasciculaceae cyanobacterium SM2_3_26]|nr:EAL domain-containing protein [Coleofasciculaceae cyanobacterium SM2_3_26]
MDHLVHHDALTKLPNQLSLREQFSDRLRMWQLNPEVSGSKVSVPVLCINLDRFDRVNDTLGYSVGDRVLKAVAEYLIASVEASSLVARMNADEFAIILPPTEHRQTAADAAQRIVEQLNQPFAIDGKEVFTTASIGVSFYPQDGQQIDKLIQNARKAMKRSKQQGGNQYELYTIAYNLGSSDRLSLETDLRYALDRDQLELHYQPQVSLEGGYIVGAEALVRWQHPERGYISPGKFIPIAEENGLIEPIGEWVLYHACQEARQWLAKGLDLRIAVNLSGRQFNQLDLRHRLVDILIRSGLEAKYLDLELTESTLVQNPEAAVRRLNALKALGVRIAIDDFGTGYSSLNYLQQFPFDILKVDRCFVRHISVDVKNRRSPVPLLRWHTNWN